MTDQPANRGEDEAGARDADRHAVSPRRADGPLTAVQHARIRTHLILLPWYISMLFFWASFFTNLPVPLRGSRGRLDRDFVQFYELGAIANERNPALLYDMDGQARRVAQLLPDAHLQAYPPVYGPQLSLLFSPFARLPYRTALLGWMLSSLAAYLACCYAVWRACPRLKHARWIASVLALGSPALFFTLVYGQTSAVGLVCVTAAYFAFRADRRITAGVCLGLLAYKPQLGLGALIFLIAGDWRVVLGAALAIAGQLGSACIYWGTSILNAYWTGLRHLPDVAARMEPFKYHQHSWRAFFQLLPLSPGVAFIAYLVAAVATLALAFVCWRSRVPLTTRYSAFLVATVLINPHEYAYDLLLLTPALLLLWDAGLGAAERPSSWFLGLLALCYVAPWLGFLAQVTKIQLSVLSLAALLYVLSADRQNAPTVAR